MSRGQPRSISFAPPFPAAAPSKEAAQAEPLMTTVDYLVVGTGLSGGTIARVLADHNREVLLLERRTHVGGNVHDFLHANGARIHSYGPHYFRCTNPRIWEFVNRFADFYAYRATVKSLVKGRYENWPVCQALAGSVNGYARAWPGEPRNFEEACLRMMPRPVYEAYVAGYTRRQWGIEPRLLEAKLANRIRINADHQRELTPHYAYQGLPRTGYAEFTAKLVAGVPCRLGVDYLKVRSEYTARKALVFTGSLDEFFEFDQGRLAYRRQERKHEFFSELKWYQPCGQINHPAAQDSEPLRTVEWKHLMPAEQRAQIRGTIVTSEYPVTAEEPDHFEYPVPTARNKWLYRQYRQRARVVPKLIVCGRLGEFCYLDMDQSIERACVIARSLGIRHQVARRSARQLLVPG